ncbi:MmpS family protein [Mycolicibacterium holsaticum]|uniref:MmpS family protein n=1 Tax=Mycolicibacterium holsaticum TaxID=152142 RepID=UPI001E5CCD35|nr:MmpS family protein [Mycolicibacterium holsaticum]
MLRRLWIPLVIAIVAVAGGFTVSRLHNVFGNEHRPTYASTETEQRRPHNPKHLTYEIFGPPGSVADISYFDDNADPQRIEGAPLPWTLDFPITEATAMGSISAQGTGDTIGCRITVGDKVEAERVRHGVSAFTFCVLKAA